MLMPPLMPPPYARCRFSLLIYYFVFRHAICYIMLCCCHFSHYFSLLTDFAAYLLIFSLRYFDADYFIDVSLRLIFTPLMHFRRRYALLLHYAIFAFAGWLLPPRLAPRSPRHAIAMFFFDFFACRYATPFRHYCFR